MDRAHVVDRHVDAAVGEIARILAEGYSRHQRKSRLTGLPGEEVEVEPEAEILLECPDSGIENPLDHSLAQSVNGLG